MTLDYIYHSGFAIEMEGVTIIIDYYKVLCFSPISFFSSTGLMT